MLARYVFMSGLRAVLATWTSCKPIVGTIPPVISIIPRTVVRSALAFSQIVLRLILIVLVKNLSAALTHELVLHSTQLPAMAERVPLAPNHLTVTRLCGATAIHRTWIPRA